MNVFRFFSWHGGSPSVAPPFSFSNIGRAIVRHGLPWLVPLLLVVVWQVASALGWINHRVLPAPLEVVKAGVELTVSGDIWTHLKISFWRVSVGFAIGGSLGLLLGLISGLSKLGEGVLDTSLQMLRNIPPLALIPLVILWFGIDESAKVFLVAFGVLFPLYLNTYHGIRTIDPALLEMARSYGLHGFSLFRHVLLPGSLPSILVGVRYALGIAWIILIVAETISANSGIGYLAMNAREFLQTEVVVLAILLYALLGKLVDMLARAIERRSLRWHPSYQTSGQ
ncbi:MAG TPA: aliphatic sulfonate ABC transporter permease SsuC [Chromobacteriaceae bacterium]|nr:aliphatic sulfonate ABC transporter permease SsuC [Chromobacteriaceae bacterium]